MLYTFETQYPAPFDQTWLRSKRRFHTAKETCEAISAWLLVGIENGTAFACRIVELSETE